MSGQLLACADCRPRPWARIGSDHALVQQGVVVVVHAGGVCGRPRLYAAVVIVVAVVDSSSSDAEVPRSQSLWVRVGCGLEDGRVGGTGLGRDDVDGVLGDHAAAGSCCPTGWRPRPGQCLTTMAIAGGLRLFA